MRVWLIAILAVLVMTSAADAHTDHKRKVAEGGPVAATPAPALAPAPAGGPNAMPPPGHAEMGEAMEQSTPAPKAGMARLLDWLGRMHPILVHFPIAFFPAALFTAIIGRRRPAFDKPVQFLVIAGGILAPVAALLGWLDGGVDWTTDDALLRAHRWLGTAIGLMGAALAAWAWRRPDTDRGVGMISCLAVITLAVVVQGWFGGALVHGMDHMRW